MQHVTRVRERVLWEALLTKTFPSSQLGVAPPSKMTQSCGFHPKQASDEKSQNHQSREYVLGASRSPSIEETCHSMSPKRDPARLPRARNQLRSLILNMPTWRPLDHHGNAVGSASWFLCLLSAPSRCLAKTESKSMLNVLRNL